LEAVDDTVDFPEDDPKLIARLILFLYMDYYPVRNNKTAGLDDSPAPVVEWMGSLRRLLRPSNDIFVHPLDAHIFKLLGTESMTTDVLMHALADKYEAPKLATKARQDYLHAIIRLDRDESMGDFVTSVRIVYQKTSNTDHKTPRRRPLRRPGRAEVDTDVPFGGRIL
jgi:hypothetical protein